jgi:hypothetical protein
MARAEKNGFKQVQLLSNEQEAERARLLERKKELERKKFDKFQACRQTVLRR